MISSLKRVRKTIEYVFDLPMDAREIEDAIRQVENEFPYNSYDDRYRIKSDGESLIFYWEGGAE